MHAFAQGQTTTVTRKRGLVWACMYVYKTKQINTRMSLLASLLSHPCLAYSRRPRRSQRRLRRAQCVALCLFLAEAVLGPRKRSRGVGGRALGLSKRGRGGLGGGLGSRERDRGLGVGALGFVDVCLGATDREVELRLLFIPFARARCLEA